MPTTDSPSENTSATNENPSTNPSQPEQSNIKYETASVQSLYKTWRGGDTEAGKRMAERFETWFKALSMFQLGGDGFKPPYEAACKDFSNQILQVKKVAELVPFAYSIIQKHIQQSEPTTGKDFSSAMLNNRAPYELLESTWSDLSDGDKKLLLATYGKNETLENLKKQGHYPQGLAFAILQARARLKKALNDKEKISFSFMDDVSNLDLAPLPLYESQSLQNVKEQEGFEHWLINVPQLCDDLIEFAPFAQSMRNGALEKLGRAKAKPTPTPKERRDEPTLPIIPPEEESSFVKYALLGVILAVVVAGVWIALFGGK